MADATEIKDFVVKVQRDGRALTWTIKAPSKQAAEAHAARQLKNLGGAHSKVLGATEKKQ